jgi:predicted membrane channel-forming protein YqfA (hemolysin III family)
VERSGRQSVFFVASKVFWMFLSPIVVLLVLALVGASWSRDRWRRTFRSIGIAAILVLITIAMTPLALMAAAPLENRFPHRRLTCRLPSGSSF